MFLRSLFEVLWARRAIVLIATGCSLVGGGAIVAFAAPRYQASARVVLGYIQPDPITGEYVNSKRAQVYVNTQIQMIRDLQVAIPAAEALGLLDNIDLQTAYSSTPGADPADFPAWVARRIIASTGVRLVPETNIIQIVNVSGSPDAARQYVDAVRSAYIEATVSAKRESASSNADNLARLAALEAAAIAKLEATKRQLQDVHGETPALEIARLSELVLAVRPLYVERTPKLPSAARLAEAEAALAEAGRTLGPNHPSIASLRGARDLLAQQLQREKANAAAVGEGAGFVERARQAAIDAQKEKVLSQRQLALEERLIDEEIARRRQTFNGLNTKIASLRELTAIQQVNLTPFGEVEAEPAPVFPNPPLILGGSGMLGLTLGSLLALFVEFVNRRVRRPDHLEAAVGAPLLGVLPAMPIRRRGRGWTWRMLPGARQRPKEAAA